MRRAQPREGRHQIHTLVIGDRGSQRFALAGLFHKFHFVAQPLDGRAAHEHAAFQRIGGLAVQPPGHGGQQAVFRQLELAARVHQHEAARTVGVLGHAALKARLAEQRRMLIARHGGHGHRHAQDILIQHADHL